MTRKFALLLLAGTLAFAGCDKIKMPKFGKKSEAEPTPAPAVATSSTSGTAGAEVAAPTAPPPPAEPAKPVINTHAAVMVLCFHRFEDRPKDSLAITPAEFEKEMGELKTAGFTVIPMQDFLAWRRGEKSIPDKACVVSIDDGYRSGYDVAWPILKKFGYPFTMFIYTNYVKGQPNAGGQSMSWEELAEMRDAGVDIQSHTVSHTNLRLKTGKWQKPFPTYEAWLQHEMVDSKKMLEQHLGIAVNCLAYPYGNHSEEIRKIAMASGYEAAFTVYGQRLGYNSPASQLGRYAVEFSKPQIFQSALKMIGGGVSGDETGPDVAQAAASSMITEPMEGETISNPKPKLKINLATFGDVEAGSVEMRVSGLGAVPVKYDPASKNAEAQVTQKLRDKNYTVIVTAKAKGRKIQTSWNFNFDPNAAPNSDASALDAPPPPRATPAPATTTIQPAKKPR